MHWLWSYHYNFIRFPTVQFVINTKSMQKEKKLGAREGRIHCITKSDVNVLPTVGTQRGSWLKEQVWAFVVVSHALYFPMCTKLIVRTKIVWSLSVGNPSFSSVYLGRCWYHFMIKWTTSSHHFIPVIDYLSQSFIFHLSVWVSLFILHNKKHLYQYIEPHAVLNIQKLVSYHSGVVSSPDPTYERGSGDIRLIPWASLTLITFWREIFSANHFAEKTICSATPETLGYFSTMTQHFFGA